MTNTNAIETAKTLWHKQRVKRLVRSRLGQGTPCLVFVCETVCTGRDCPGPAIEVRVVDLGLRERRFSIHKPLSGVAAADIAAAL